MGLVVGALAYAVGQNPAGDGGHGDAQRAYENAERQAQDILHVGSTWCCPEDPSSTSVLHNEALRAWAGNPEPLEETFKPWLWRPDATEFAFKASWAPRGDHGTHTIDLYRTGPSQGPTAGTQVLPQVPQQGPAYVVPRLDTVSAESSTDLIVVPVENFWPYKTDPQGAHQDHIHTNITYLRSSPGDQGTTSVEMHGYTELTGAARPAMDVSFREPDWQKLEEIESSRLGIEVELDDASRFFTQVLSKDDLLAERTIKEDTENLDDDGTFPHHRFHVQVNLTGPGAVDAGRPDTAPDGESRNLSEAYRLTVHVPRNWTDVRLTSLDRDDNEDFNWSHTTVEQLDSGGYRIESYLDVAAEFDQTGTRNVDDPRWVLNDTTEIQAPFRFHARPPAESSSSELGFQQLQATLESQRFTARDTADLTVEVASSPGRVHRTLDTHAPSLVPTTPWYPNESIYPEGVRLPLGAVLENGGEATQVQQVTWTIPQANEGGWSLEVLEDYTDAGPDPWNASHDGDTLTVTWKPNLTAVDTTCDELEACALAARLNLDGRGLNTGELWAPPQLSTLYQQADLGSYVDWFIRSEKAWDGVLEDNDRSPGFALAHRTRTEDAGPAPGAYRFTVPPTRTPVCDRGEILRRDQADRHRRGDRVHYDFGPREDGLPHVGPSGTDGCSLTSWEFTAVGKMGEAWTTEAVGHTPYRSTAHLSGQTVANWQTGLAESDLSASDEVRVGGWLNFSVKMDSLFDLLSTNNQVGDATVRAEMVDPYNAWEQAPWLQTVIRENTGFGEVSTGDPDEPRIHVTPGSGSSGSGPVRGASANTGDPIPPRYNTSVEIPEAVVPGTHLLVVEIAWEFTAADGTQLTETGRLVEPVDVVSREGNRVQGAALGMTAWNPDRR